MSFNRQASFHSLYGSRHAGGSQAASPALPGRYPPDFTSLPSVQPLTAGPPSEPHRVLMATLSRRRRHVGRKGARQPMSL